MDSLWCLRDLPFHTMQSGAAAMIRLSGNLFDVASAICSRPNCALGFCQSASCPFTQERPLSDGLLVQSWPCRGCTTYRLQWLVHGCQVPFFRRKLWMLLWDVVKDWIAHGITINVLPCCAPLLPSGLAFLLRLSSTTCCSKLPFVVTDCAHSCLV